ncbi:hypothetical protein Y032_0534g3067 [Ancylostoma ceylanicum]|uniref:Uncharacterized protein n=1 Tax=Ancylostoma ceylanicum TaxID=53326 RepID=A0A016WTI6_9BILA|nr:hypothetical protein Y032_0534g3067 [Ancylostoma ceylanicum]
MRRSRRTPPRDRAALLSSLNPGSPFKVGAFYDTGVHLHTLFASNDIHLSHLGSKNLSISPTQLERLKAASTTRT